jgi:hypothetical protein
LSAFAWIFFRANNVKDAFLIIKKIFTETHFNLFLNWEVFFAAILGLTILFLKELREEYFVKKFSFFKNTSIRLTIYAFLIILIILFGVFDSGQFIYFQF